MCIYYLIIPTDRITFETTEVFLGVSAIHTEFDSYEARKIIIQIINPRSREPIDHLFIWGAIGRYHKLSINPGGQ